MANCTYCGHAASPTHNDRNDDPCSEVCPTCQMEDRKS